MRLHDGRVYLTLGCNMECSVYAHGHLNLMRGRRHLGLRSVLTTLTAGHATRIALSLSHSNLSAVHRALDRGYPVKIVIRTTLLFGTRRPGAGYCATTRRKPLVPWMTFVCARSETRASACAASRGAKPIRRGTESRREGERIGKRCREGPWIVLPARGCVSRTSSGPMVTTVGRV